MVSFGFFCKKKYGFWLRPEQILFDLVIMFCLISIRFESCFDLVVLVMMFVYSKTTLLIVCPFCENCALWILHAMTSLIGFNQNHHFSKTLPQNLCKYHLFHVAQTQNLIAY
jgi:hypothetical protein